MKPQVSLDELKKEIDLIKKKYPTFKDDSAFVFWFLYAYLIDREEIVKSALTGKEGGKSGEKNIDAIYIDHENQQCNIIQGKFHKTEGVREKRNDIIAFADLAFKPWESQTVLKNFYNELDPIVNKKFDELINCVKNKNYILNLYYVTTGICTDSIIDEVKSKVRQSDKTEIFILTYNNVLKIFEDYLNDITPHIPPLKLKIVTEGVVQHEGTIHRFDPKTKVESWVVSACGYDIVAMYSKVGKRIFSKNIRGWLGCTEINNSILNTTRQEPDNFWYYNNGITIVCEEAKKEQQGGEDFLTIEGAQIINGQQTTRALHCSGKDSKNINVLVKIIKIPRYNKNENDYDKLINSIVRATNWQNYIRPSDLISNDYFQIFLEKEFRKRGYQYIRKRMKKTEARTFLGQGYWQIEKSELAQAIGACLFDPVIVRKGKEGLFEDQYYKSIFSSKKISFYLSKWWLMRNIQSVARGYPERAYAKWLVLNFIWNQISSIIDSNSMCENFIYACEHQDDKVLNPLNKSLVHIFRAALKFYRFNRGAGEEAKDISTFFKLTKLHIKFKKYWDSNKNSFKNRVKKNIEKFKKNLKKIYIY